MHNYLKKTKVYCRNYSFKNKVEFKNILVKFKHMKNIFRLHFWKIYLDCCNL